MKRIAYLYRRWEEYEVERVIGFTFTLVLMVKSREDKNAC